MGQKVFIIGGGIIAAPGESLSEVAETLNSGNSSIQRLKNFDSGLADVPLVGEVKKTNKELAAAIGLSLSETYSRTMLLGLWAVKQAVESALLNKDHLKKACLISANTVGGMDQTEQTIQDYFQNPPSTNLISISEHHCGAAAEFISRFLGIEGYVTTINTACSSSANSIILGARMIMAGETELVIAGGTDALCSFTLNGFQSLMLVSAEACKPFDQNRDGLNLGEGAGYIVLCSEKLVKEFRPIGELAGWANANDAYHQTATSPEGRGPALAMEKAMEKAGVLPDNIDYLNAHGTATPNNDQAEATAICRLFSSIPAFSSTKPFTGHTLGAAGAIEAVISLLAIRGNKAFANLNHLEPMKDLPIKPLTETLNKKIDIVLSNSFGFGGNCSSLVFKRYTA